MSSVLVFDVGGTNLRAGLYSPVTRRVEKSIRRETPSLPESFDMDPRLFQLFREMHDMAVHLLGEVPSGVVSVAFPGPIAPDGRVLAAPTVWKGDGCRGSIPVGDILRGLWPKARVFVINDVSAAGYACMRHPEEDFCILTVGTGIGHKVFIRGEPVTGTNGRGGELGHLRVDFSADAPACDCGGLGHLGAVASGSAGRHHVTRLAREDPQGFMASDLARRTGADPDRVDNESIVAAFRVGDTWTRRAVQRLVDPLGQVLAAIHLTVGVERFVIVGGFALALGPGFREMLAAASAGSAWDLGADWDRMIELSPAGLDAGLIGAGVFASSRGR